VFILLAVPVADALHIGQFKQGVAVRDVKDAVSDGVSAGLTFVEKRKLFFALEGELASVTSWYEQHTNVVDSVELVQEVHSNAEEEAALAPQPLPDAPASPLPPPTPEATFASSQTTSTDYTGEEGANATLPWYLDALDGTMDGSYTVAATSYANMARLPMAL
jgi:hypothetical protein